MMIFGVIMAGGLSSRMGQDKAELELDGSSLLERTRSLLEAVGADKVLISGRAHLNNGFADVYPNCGPPGALLSTLLWLRQHHGLDGSLLLFLPVDMPLLQADTLLELIEAGREVNACHYEQQVFPCVMKATENLHGWLQEAFQQGLEPGGRRSMKAVLGWLEAQRLPLDESKAQQFRNANTPEEWEEVQALHAAAR